MSTALFCPALSNTLVLPMFAADLSRSFGLRRDVASQHDEAWANFPGASHYNSLGCRGNKARRLYQLGRQLAFRFIVVFHEIVPLFEFSCTVFSLAVDAKRDKSA